MIPSKWRFRYRKELTGCSVRQAYGAGVALELAGADEIKIFGSLVLRRVCESCAQ